MLLSTGERRVIRRGEVLLLLSCGERIFGMVKLYFSLLRGSEFSVG